MANVSRRRIQARYPPFSETKRRRRRRRLRLDGLQVIAFLSCLLTYDSSGVSPLLSEAFVAEQMIVSYWGSNAAASTTSTSRAARERSPPGGDGGGGSNNYRRTGGGSSNGFNSRGAGGFGHQQNRGGGGRRQQRVRGGSNSTIDAQSPQREDAYPSAREINMLKRQEQLEQLVSSQVVEIKRLKDEVKDLTRAAGAFARVVELLREAGLQTEEVIQNRGGGEEADSTGTGARSGKNVTPVTGSNNNVAAETFDDADIFGRAPSSVIEAADVAGASILAGMLGGKQRMLVDVRDAELSTSSETLVQFIELAVLPVAGMFRG